MRSLRLQNLSPAATVGCAILLLVGIGAFDYMTGTDLSLSIFYLAPISLVAWAVGRRAALFLSFIGAAIWLAADLACRTSAGSGIPYWNSAVRFGFFGIVSVLLANLRSARDGLEATVRSRTASLEAEIGEHKRAEAELRRIGRALRTLSDCNQLLVRTTEEADLLQGTCRILVETGGYGMVWVGFAEQDEEKTVRPVAQAGFDQGYLESFKVTWADTETGRGPAGTAIRTGQPCMVKDLLAGGEHPPWCAEATKRGFASCISLPLVVSGRALGVLSVLAADPDAFDREEARLLAELAADLAYGLAALRGRAARERAEAALRESEGRLRMVVESSMDAIVAVDERAMIVLFNAAAEELFGYLAQEAVGTPVSLLVRESAAEVHQQRLEKFMLRGDGRCGHIGRRTEQVFRRKNGDTFVGEVAMAGSRSAEKRLIVVSVHDVTERKRAEEALRERDENLRLLGSAVPDVLWMSTPDISKMLYVSSNYERLWGQSVESLFENPLSYMDPIHPEDRERVILALAGHLQGHYDVEYRLLSPDGSIRWIHDHGAPVCDAQGHVVRICGVASDITERKRTETSLRDSEARYRVLFEGAAEGILVADIETKKFLFANTAICKLLGYSQGELTAMGVTDIHPKESLAHVLSAFEAQARREFSIAPVLPCLRKDGTVINADINTASIVIDGRQCNVGFFTDVTERMRAEQEIRNLAKFPMENPDAVLRIDRGGKVIFANPASASMLEAWDCGLGRPLPDQWRTLVAEALESGKVNAAEAECGNRLMALNAVPVVGAGYVNLYGRDITDLRRAEEQLLQAQKMEAIGQLAGGVAHDFRNQLTVIKGFSEMLLRRSLVKDEGRDKVAEILKAVERSSTLASELLAFGRKQIVRPEVVNLDDLITAISEPLARMIGEDIRLSIVPSSNLGNVKLDPSEFQHALTNIVLNARDAMPQGGQLAIGTANVDLAEGYVRQHMEASVGPHVMVTVSDTGTGMDPKTLERIFEPFFTTKPTGKGTGLGLSMVYGFVKQAGGHIGVYSEPGHGTTVKLYFPHVAGEAKATGPAAEPAPLQKGTGTVLVVEDEESVRRFVVQTLAESGYTVLEAADPQQGIALAEKHEGRIDLLLTDMVMPDMNGPELAKRVSAGRPGIRLLYVSGYTGDSLMQRGVVPENMPLLVKPFGAGPLIQAVQAALRGSDGQ